MTSAEVSTRPQFTADHPDIEISPAQEKAQTHVNCVRLLEKGLLEPAELASFVGPYSQAMGDPDLSREFSQRFGVGQTPPPTPPQV